MPKKKKSKRKARPIVEGHIEKVGSGIFDKYKKQITDMIRGNHGIYALYTKDKLYYVGLASNLKLRIKQHLKDKHSNQWTHFSLYIFKKADHIRELEAMILRIAYPKGNSQKGKLKESSDLKPILKKKVKDHQHYELIDLFMKHKATKVVTKKIILSKKNAASKKNDCPLRGIFKTGKVIYATYNGKDYKAWVYSNGRIKFDGNIYNTPSAVGKIIRGGKATNGWGFWKSKNKNGDLVKLAELRK